MKWLIYIPQHTVPENYPQYRRGEIAPVMKWYEYRAGLLQKGTEEFWYANSKIDEIRGTYGCYFTRFLKADFTFGWDIQNLDEYDGIVVAGDLSSAVYLRRKYSRIIVGAPRLPYGTKYPKKVLESVDAIFLNHEPGIETAENLNRINKTDKFHRFFMPSVAVDFLRENFYKSIDEKERRIITFRPSSGPPRGKSGGIGGRAEGVKRFRQKMFRKSRLFMRFYKSAIHRLAKRAENVVMTDRRLTMLKTAEYLREFQKHHPEVQGYMTKALNEAPRPFIGIDIKCADDYYRFIGESYMMILASTCFGSTTQYGACVGTPSVGSIDTTTQKLLFPDLSFDEDDVQSIVSAMLRLFEDEDLYIEQQRKGLQNAEKWLSDDSCRQRFYGIVRRLHE